MQVKFPTPSVQRLFSISAFFLQYKKKIAVGLLLVVMGSILLTKGLTNKDRQLGDYLQAAAYQAQVQGEKEVSLDTLQYLIDKYPDLHPSFAPYLAQRYALEGDVDKIQQIVESSLKRLSFLPSPYQEYAYNSLRIERGLYEEALQQALLLQAEPQSQLHALNLTRIEFLKSLIVKS